MLTILALTAALAQAAGQTPAPAAPKPPARANAVEHIKVHGKALEGNLEGDSPDRDVTVYLPPSYATDTSRRYPVVYLLHGYGGRDDTFNGRLATLPDSADKLAAAGTAREMIVVMPNAFTLHKGSMYSNSVTTGDWETYVAARPGRVHGRPLPDDSEPDVARSRRSFDGRLRRRADRDEAPRCVLEPLPHELVLSQRALTFDPGRMAPAEAIKTREAAEEAGRGRGFGPSVNLAEGAAWSPNPGNPPLYLDLPVKDGKLQPDVIAKWAANAPLAMVGQYIPSLKMYNAIAMEVGTKDGLLASNKELEQTFTRFGVDAHVRGVRRRPHQQGVRAHRDERAAVLLEAPVVRRRTSSTKH